MTATGDPAPIATSPSNTPTIVSTSMPSPTMNFSPSPATAPTSVVPLSTNRANKLEQEMIDEINRLRREQGCAVALQRSPELTAAARKHSGDMAENNFFDHRGSNGSDRISRAQAAGYSGALGTRVRENIGAGPIPADVVGYWMNLDAIHRSQILDCAYNDIGVGYAMGDGNPYTHYWTVNFGIGPR
jgi:uncharacterized protein YkwD